MTDHELLENYIRVRATASRIFIEVRMPGESELQMAERWSLAAALPRSSSPAHTERARLMTLSDYRFFRVCDECGTRASIASVRATEDGRDVCLDCAPVSSGKPSPTQAP